MRANYCTMISLSTSILKYFLNYLAENVIKFQASQALVRPIKIIIQSNFSMQLHVLIKMQQKEYRLVYLLHVNCKIIKPDFIYYIIMKYIK